jgi:hypothetical protein
MLKPPEAALVKYQWLRVAGMLDRVQPQQHDRA